MENVKFKVAEEVINFKIPFELDDKSLTDWLNSLLSLEQSEAIKNIFYVIETLSNTDIPIKQQSVFYKKISAYMNIIIERIDNKYVDLAFPLRDEEERVMEWVVWSYLGLAHSFDLMAKEVKDKRKKVNFWYHALNAMAQGYLYISAVYALPGKGFWQQCFQIYYAADEAGLLLKPLAESSLKEETIDKLFKQIVLFSVSDPAQYKAREMKVVFEFLGRYTSQLKIKEKANEDKKGIFVFNSVMDRQPVELVGIETINESYKPRYIATVALAKQIYQAIHDEKKVYGSIKSINQALFIRLIKSLGMAQKRKYSRIEEERIIKGIVGFNYISSYLRNKFGETEAEIKSKQKQKQNYDLIPTGEGYELLPNLDGHAHKMRPIFKEEIEKNEQIKNIFKVSFESSSELDVWDTANNNNELIDNVQGSEFSLFNSSANGYSLCWNSREDKAKLGEVFGINSDDSKSLEIAIIRRINQITENSVRLSVEVLGMESAPVYITRPNDEDSGRWAIFLPGVKALNKADSLIFKTGEYDVGEFIKLHQNKEIREYRLAKVLNSTQTVSQFELFSIQADEETT